MYTEGRHSHFIRTPLASVLDDGANACRGVGYGIETYPLCDHVMQSLFLRMTGAQEQKMKCICWELATDDYDFRYQYLHHQKEIGEQSTYDSKNMLYNQLLKMCSIRKAYIMDCNSRSAILSRSIQKTISFSWTNLGYGDEQGRTYFIGNAHSVIDKDDFGEPSGLFKEDLKKIYNEVVYRHRNRCAHNTTSYQENLPAFSSLAQSDHPLHNYFFRFAILLLIDEIFMHLYKQYSDEMRWRFL